MLPVLNETRFWRQFTKHEAFLRRMRDTKDIQWTEDLRPKTTFLALVLAVMVVGLMHSMDMQLLRQFQMRLDMPVSRYLNLTFRLLCALDFQESPTLDTLRTFLVTFQIIFQSRAGWTSNSFATCLTQAALGLELDLDPPDQCGTDEF